MRRYVNKKVRASVNESKGTSDDVMQGRGGEALLLPLPSLLTQLSSVWPGLRACVSTARGNMQAGIIENCTSLSLPCHEWATFEV